TGSGNISGTSPSTIRVMANNILRRPSSKRPKGLGSCGLDGCDDGGLADRISLHAVQSRQGIARQGYGLDRLDVRSKRARSAELVIRFIPQADQTIERVS